MSTLLTLLLWAQVEFRVRDEVLVCNEQVISPSYLRPPFVFRCGRDIFVNGFEDSS